MKIKTTFKIDEICDVDLKMLKLSICYLFQKVSTPTSHKYRFQYKYQNRRIYLLVRTFIFLKRKYI